jgi:hypothetical protein
MKMIVIIITLIVIGIMHSSLVALCGLVVSVLAVGSRVLEFIPCGGR